MMRPNLIQERILIAMRDSGGSMTIPQLESLYEPGRRDGLQVATLNKRGLSEWIRPAGRPGGNAIGIRITDAGRAALSSHMAPSEHEKP